MAFEPLDPIHMPPLEVAPETFLIRSVQPALGAPLSISLNSLVIRGDEPIIVDTGTIANRERWLHDVTSLVDPADVRWIFLSHDDEDHTGNLALILELCPQATLVTNWAATERMGSSFHAPPDRLRWIDDGGTLDAGDRVLTAIRPPVYDSPTTRALFDHSTGVLWASDTFATPMTADPVERVDDLPPEMWAEGMAMFHHHGLSPWLTMVDRDAYAAEVARFAALQPRVITGAHTPLITGPVLDTAMRHLAGMPAVTPPPHPDQAVLDIIRGASVPPAATATT